MAGKKNSSDDKAGSERFITSASGIDVIKKGGGKPRTVKRSGNKAKGGK